ncbi:MAG: hypothetical protein IH586_06325 [Anaerolineaceae bacterium]|nr:hypothetical protein [Anaerolineaceae bacterium]
MRNGAYGPFASDLIYPMDKPTIYRIQIRGHLPASWSTLLGGLAVICEPNGNNALWNGQEPVRTVWADRQAAKFWIDIDFSEPERRRTMKKDFPA